MKAEANGQWQAIARKVLDEGSHQYPFSAYDLILEENAGVLKARIAVSRPDGTRGVVYSDSALNYGQWYQLFGTNNGNTLRIFVNGVEDGSAPFSGAIVQTNEPLLIGRNGSGPILFRE